MGLSYPSESADFCDVCGVCHSGNVHAPTMMLGNHGNRSLKKLAQGSAAGPQSLPPIQNSALDSGAIRDLVAAVVQKTMGELS